MERFWAATVQVEGPCGVAVSTLLALSAHLVSRHSLRLLAPSLGAAGVTWGPLWLLAVLFFLLATGGGWLTVLSASRCKAKIRGSQKAGTGVSASSVVGCSGAVIWAGCSSSRAAITAAIFNWTALCFHALGGRETFVLQQLCHPCLLDKGSLATN